MKTITFAAAAVCTLIAVTNLRADEPAVSPAEASKPACCCAAPKPTDPAATSLTDRSIYQLEANWTNDTGHSVTLAELRGRPVVLTMFFANCEYACPILVNDMQRIRQSLPEAVRAQTQFVLVSFDESRDTPEALRAYRERANLDSSWVLLRGGASDVQELAMLLGVKFQRDARGQFAHSNLITVLNAAGEIVHQRNGLQGEVSQAAHAVQLAAR